MVSRCVKVTKKSQIWHLYMWRHDDVIGPVTSLKNSALPTWLVYQVSLSCCDTPLHSSPYHVGLFYMLNPIGIFRYLPCEVTSIARFMQMRKLSDLRFEPTLEIHLFENARKRSNTHLWYVYHWKERVKLYHIYENHKKSPARLGIISC